MTEVQFIGHNRTESKKYFDIYIYGLVITVTVTAYNNRDFMQ